MKDTCLLVIDMQKEYFEKDRPLFIPNGEKVLKNVKQLLAFARKKNLSVIHIRHVSKNPNDSTFAQNSPFLDFIAGAEPKDAEPIITKSTPGAFYRTNLDKHLKKKRIKTIIICGLTSFLCCDTTSREAKARGYKVLFIKDATAALGINKLTGKEVHNTVCAIQAWYFAKVINTNEILISK